MAFCHLPCSCVIIQYRAGRLRRAMCQTLGTCSLSYSVFWTAISALHLPHLIYRSAGSVGSSSASRIIIRLWGEASPTRCPQPGHVSLTTFFTIIVCLGTSPRGPFAIGTLLLFDSASMESIKPLFCTAVGGTLRRLLEHHPGHSHQLMRIRLFSHGMPD